MNKLCRQKAISTAFISTESCSVYHINICNQTIVYEELPYIKFRTSPRIIIHFIKSLYIIFIRIIKLSDRFELIMDNQIPYFTTFSKSNHKSPCLCTFDHLLMPKSILQKDDNIVYSSWWFVLQISIYHRL